MFGFIQWDSPLALLAEFLFALLVFIGILVVVRRVEDKRPAEERRHEPGDEG